MPKKICSILLAAILLIPLCCAGIGLTMVIYRAALPLFPAASGAPGVGLTVILDAGHGGEDGGASSASGLLEKDLNLDITLRLERILREAGAEVILTRSEDILLYDRNVDYHGRKKALDLAARRAVAEANPDALFVSIHMNAYPVEKYSGLQVWYSKNHSDSAALARAIQAKVVADLQPTNKRVVKAATSSIYLLHHIQSPAVLIECGFLSNANEAARLGDEGYRELLVQTIADAILESRSEGN